MIIKDQTGYSLVELLVALVISLIVMGGIYLTSISQERNLHIEDRIAELQANLRAGLYLLERDLRLAGYDPMCISPPCYNVGFTNASATSLTFSMRKPDTNAIQTIAYSLYDSQSDGDDDLGRAVDASGNQPLILNVDALNFVYFDKSGNRLTTLPLSASDLKKVRVIEVTIVAHSEIQDPNYTSNQSFTNLQGETIFTPSANDHFRRRSISSRILCRNAF